MELGVLSRESASFLGGYGAFSGPSVSIETCRALRCWSVLFVLRRLGNGSLACGDDRLDDRISAPVNIFISEPQNLDSSVGKEFVSNPV